MPHPLRTCTLVVALLVTNAACDTALSRPAHEANVANGPSVTVTPPVASTTAGGSTLPFDAVLANTTGTVTWSLSQAHGSVSPTTGTHVVYTPPATVLSQTTVTLTATRGTLTGSAVITIRPPPTLTLTPTSATFNAGGAGRTFDATLANTTATLTWSLSAAVGGISPSTGTSVTYTPPATIDATTVVTLTVSGAGLSARARLTVQPSTDPLLSVTPPTASTSAGGATLGFDAALANTTGTIGWALSGAIGSISPSSGTHVTYTPPPAPTFATTTVTLTATRGTLTDTASITVIPVNLTVTPPAASTSAGGTTLGFDATLVNTTGTVTWALSEATGSLSASTGIHVTYTPPATLDAATVVTLTATRGVLSDTSLITVQKQAGPTPANVVNHTNFDPSAIPISYLNTVRGWDILFQHKSIGYNMTHGMQTLQAQNASRYTISLVGWHHGTNLGSGWTENMPPATWFDSNNALGNSENGHSTDALSKTTAFNQTVRGLPISYTSPYDGFVIGNDSGVSGEYGAHVDVAMMKFCFEEVWRGTAQGTFDGYRATMEGLIAAYPQVTFIWMTMPLPFTNGQADPSDVGHIATDFNALLRAYITAHGGYLLDVADLESNCQDGSVATDARGHPAVCASWADTVDPPHMNAAGEVRLAQGLWSILARAAGYAP